MADEGDNQLLAHIETTLRRHLDTPFLYSVDEQPKTINDVYEIMRSRRENRLMYITFALRSMYADNPDLLEELIALPLLPNYEWLFTNKTYTLREFTLPCCVFKTIQDLHKNRVTGYVIK
jgi:hypothetical protein